MSKRSRKKRRNKNKQKVLKTMPVSTKPDTVKIFIVRPPASFNGPYSTWIRTDPELEEVDHPEDADALMFTGGSDVTPSLYGQPKHSRTYSVPERDRHELAMYLMAPDKFKIGICRGAQFLNVLSGGSLIQHVERHTSPHDLCLLSEGGMIIRGVPSTHHQMMLPNPHVWTREVLATAYEEKHKRSFLATYNEKHVPPQMFREKWNFLDKYKTPDFDPFVADAEIILYRSTNSLCIQSHPEKDDCPGPFKAYCGGLISKVVKSHKKLQKLNADNQQPTKIEKDK